MVEFEHRELRGKQVVLIEGGQRYLFRYFPGGEARVREEAARMAEDPDCGLSWFAAAILSYEIGLRSTRG